MTQTHTFISVIASLANVNLKCLCLHDDGMDVILLNIFRKTNNGVLAMFC